EQFNYFYPNCPEGIYNVRGFQKITIKEIYPGIDWVLYGSDKTEMKYDFIVHSGADPGQIKLVYESSKQLQLDKQGNIQIETPLGTLTEHSPVSYLKETRTPVASNFTASVVDKNNVAVSINVLHPSNSTLIIDPQQVWGTFFSG